MKNRRRHEIFRSAFTVSRDNEICVAEGDIKVSCAIIF